MQSPLCSRMPWMDWFSAISCAAHAHNNSNSWHGRTFKDSAGVVRGDQNVNAGRLKQSKYLANTTDEKTGLSHTFVYKTTRAPGPVPHVEVPAGGPRR